MPASTTAPTTAPASPTPVSSSHGEPARELGLVGTVRREPPRGLPHDCPPPSAVAPTLLGRPGRMRTTRLADLLGIDVPVTSRHVTHTADHGRTGRRPEPLDGRVRLPGSAESGGRLPAELRECVSGTLAHHLADRSAEAVGHLAELPARLRASFDDCGRRTARGTRGVAPHPATVADG